MTTTTRTMLVTRIAVAAVVAVSGYIHADLYLHGYQFIPTIGPAFLLQASGSFAVALLLLAGGPPLIRWAAAALAAGALVGFALSRTTGLFGFTETGLQPAPQALISILAELATLALLAGPLIAHRGLRDLASRLRSSRGIAGEEPDADRYPDDERLR